MAAETPLHGLRAAALPEKCKAYYSYSFALRLHLFTYWGKTSILTASYVILQLILIIQQFKLLCFLMRFYMSWLISAVIRNAINWKHDPAFAGRVREPAVLCVRGGCGLNLLRGGWGLYLLRARVEKFFVRVTECWAEGHSSKIAKHVDVLKLFASTALRTVGLQQLLYYDVTTHCCEALAQTLAMWWASEHFPMLPSYLVRNNSV